MASINDYSVGMTVYGEITGIKPYGAFVDDFPINIDAWKRNFFALDFFVNRAFNVAKVVMMFMIVMMMLVVVLGKSTTIDE